MSLGLSGQSVLVCTADSAAINRGASSGRSYNCGDTDFSDNLCGHFTVDRIRKTV